MDTTAAMGGTRDTLEIFPGWAKNLDCLMPRVMLLFQVKRVPIMQHLKVALLESNRFQKWSPK